MPQIVGGVPVFVRCVNAIGPLLLAVFPSAQHERVAKLLPESGSENRRQVIQDHQNVLSLTGSAVRGNEIFKKQCSTCHKLDNIGPNLRSLTDLKPSSLLTSILDPSAAVDGKETTSDSP